MTHLVKFLAVVCSVVIHGNCCDVATVEGQPSKIVCPYTANLVQQRLNVNIYRRPLKGTIDSTVLACLWNNAGLRCIEGNDVQFVGYDNHTVTFMISDTKKVDDGVYNCTYDFATPSSNIQQCRLYVKDKNTSCTGASVTEGNDVMVTCHLNGNLNVTKDSFWVKHKSTGRLEYDSVLTCVYKSDNDDWFCLTSSSFTTASWVINGSTVTLTSPNASAQHNGSYCCNTLPYSPAVHVEVCSVAVSAKAANPEIITTTSSTLSPNITSMPSTATSTTTSTTTPTSNMTRPSGTRSSFTDETESNSGYATAWLVIGAITLVLIVGLSVHVITVCSRWWKEKGSAAEVASLLDNSNKPEDTL